ncbi:thiamine-phosphate kinase [Yaniella sp.]|uniref:thiamine-phosphate kinase n=1 Tax=Yaniella sp. TaxID=2773929 RepID=UPI002649BE46|nr:thiamine-phosphate kinase [Yaniella sp.]MDN6358595.1 thiamine-phosphate kinase [Yaniella sp.]
MPLSSENPWPTTVDHLGEDAILALLNASFAEFSTGEGVLGPGDDAAIIPAPRGNFVISTDAMNEGHHFLRHWPSGIIDDGYSTGWKLVAQNISDMNAMGAVTSAINISLAMPKDTTAAWVSRFGQGIANACRYLNAGQTIISGGDLTRADTISVVITATGNLVGEPTLRTANHDVEGFNLIHTGNVGASAAGLAVALHGNAHDLSRDELRMLRLFLRPRPHLAAGPAVAGQVSAMMDISDSVLTDADRLASANNLYAAIDHGWAEVQAAQLRPVADRYAVDPRDWVLTGGEDYGLLAVQRPDLKVPPGWHVIGKLSRKPQDRPTVTGWDHF